jgi:RNA polymerase sigma-70 factor, ECF subfamily
MMAMMTQLASLAPSRSAALEEAVTLSGSAPAPRVAPTSGVCARPSFERIYEEHFDFIWRSMRRLGISAHNIDDAVQDVFLVVHRRLEDFEERCSLKTWLFGIALRVAHDHHRRSRRKGGHEPLDPAVVDGSPGPHEELAKAEAVRELDRILNSLDEDKRAVFILAEIEQMTAPEIAEALGINVNTVYSRLRSSRRAFEAALARRNGGLR